mmetsp:Transcript_11886/g.11940  ORF Transcript_11886/g.11940 Transcript_11886/m.11940 type:complete len:82 (+) Transcript_11886:49-294(+)
MLYQMFMFPKVIFHKMINDICEIANPFVFLLAGSLVKAPNRTISFIKNLYVCGCALFSFSRKSSFLPMNNESFLKFQIQRM